MNQIPGIQPIRYCGLAVAACSAVALIAGLTLTRPMLWQPAAVALAVALAIGVGAIVALRGYQFTFWIIASVIAAMLYPIGVVHWGWLDLSNKTVLLITIQLVMFGMGTHMTLHDFAGVVRMPKGVIVGLIAQFSIMPIVGFTLTKVFHFPPEISAGIVLIGSCSSGLASNVMTYLAGANLALSVTLTTCGTMLAPFITPLWMKFLAGAYVHVDVFGMMMEIVKIVLVPVGAALLHDYLKFASKGPRLAIYTTGAVGSAYLAWIALTPAAQHGTAAVIVGFLFAAVIAAIVYHHLAAALPWLNGMMPAVSMWGIVIVIAVTTAAGRNNLLVVGAMLFVAAAMHNTIGYGLGYGLARICGLGKADARTVAIEVGLHNGGMAAGIAAQMGKLGTVGLASVIFSPWMNVSGSILANYWRKRPVAPARQPESEMQRGFEVIQPAPAGDAVRTA